MPEREGKKTNRGAFKRQAQQSVICSVIEAEQNPGLDGGATNGSVPLLSASWRVKLRCPLATGLDDVCSLFRVIKWTSGRTRSLLIILLFLSLRSLSMTG